MSFNPERLLTVVSNHDPDQPMQFEAAVENYQTELYTFAYRILGRRADAEDALQNAFLKAFRAIRAGNVRLEASSLGGVDVLLRSRKLPVFLDHGTGLDPGVSLEAARGFHDARQCHCLGRAAFRSAPANGYLRHLRSAQWLAANQALSLRALWHRAPHDA